MTATRADGYARSRDLTPLAQWRASGLLKIVNCGAAGYRPELSSKIEPAYRFRISCQHPRKEKNEERTGSELKLARAELCSQIENVYRFRFSCQPCRSFGYFDEAGPTQQRRH